MTRDQFDVEMARMGGLRFVAADMETHWEGLRDIPLPVLQAAVTLAIRTRVDFPTPVELRRDADQVRARQTATEDDRGTDLERPVVLGHLPTGREVKALRLWRYYCDDCSDSGWQSCWCGSLTNTVDGQEIPNLARKPWQEIRTCDHRGEHYAHEWVRQCACWDTNPALVKKREASRKYAEPGKRVA